MNIHMDPNSVAVCAIVDPMVCMRPENGMTGACLGADMLDCQQKDSGLRVYTKYTELCMRTVRIVLRMLLQSHNSGQIRQYAVYSQIPAPHPQLNMHPGSKAMLIKCRWMSAY